MPHQIVVEVLGSDPVEAYHKGLQLAMVSVDVLDAKGAVRATVGLQLQEVDFLLFREAHITVQFVGTQHRIRCNLAAEHAGNAGDRRPAEIRNLRDGLAVTIDRTWHADLVQRYSSLLGTLTAYMRLSRHGKALTVAMVALEGYAEESLVGFHDAIQLDLGLHFLQGIKYLVAEEEGCVLGNLALVSGCADGHAVHHAVHILHVGFQVQLGSVEDGAGGVGESLATAFADETLVAGLGLAVLLAVNETAMRAEHSIVETILVEELFHCGRVDNLGHLGRHAEHLHESHLVLFGQGVIHLVHDVDF